MKRTPTPPLLALQGNPRLRGRLRLAVDSGTASRIIGPTIFASGWGHLGELAESHARSPAVVDPGYRSPRDPPEADSIWRLHGLPTALVCYGEPTSLPESQPAGSKMRFEAVLRPEVDDDFDAIEAVVLRTAGAPPATRLLADVARRTSNEVERIFAAVVAASIRPFSVSQLAARLLLSRRTLFRRCAALDIPTPKRLCSLGRIFTVERLADWSGQPSGAVALALGFSDYANYRRLVRRVLGSPPSIVRQRGGLEFVTTAILRELSGSRRQNQNGTF